MADELNWDAAKKHLDEMRRMYTEIGAAGVIGLTLGLNPLLVRYERGERTRKLYNEIMETA